MPRNKINEILTVYLRKRRIYIHKKQTHDFGGTEVLGVN